MIKRGFTLSEMLIVMVIIGIISAVTIPMLTMKKKIKDYETSSITCARTELAASVTFPATTPSTECASAINKAQYGKENAINTLAFLMSNGKDVNEKTAASKILRTACDNGGDKACGYFVKACQKDSTLCDTGGLYDLRYYLELMPNTNDSPKFLMYDAAKPLYDSNNTNIKNIVDYACCPNVNMACYINGCTECPWIKGYGGPTLNYPDQPRGIAASGDYIYIAGIYRKDTNGYFDVLVAKIKKSDGSLDWKKSYGGAGSDYNKAIAVSGNYVYVASTEYSDTAGMGDAYIMKLNASDGTAIWKKRYGGIRADSINSIVISHDGNYIYTVGTEDSDKFGATNGANDAFVMKVYTGDGTTTNASYPGWKKHYGGTSNETGYSIAISPDGNYIYVTGSERSDTTSAGTSPDIYIMKLNASNGTATWKKRYGTAGSENINSIVISPDGNYIYATGEIWPECTNAGILLMKVYTGDGTTTNATYPGWKRRYDGAEYEFGNSIAISPDGNYIYVTGYEESDIITGESLYIMKTYTGDGRTNNATYPGWEKHYGGDNYDNGEALIFSENYIYVLLYNSSDWDQGVSAIMKLSPNQTTNMNPAKWTIGGTAMGAGWTIDGVNIRTAASADNSAWVTSGAVTNGTGGNGLAMGTNWTVDGLDIKTVDNTASSLWITGGAGTTGGTGTDLSEWRDLFVRKTTNGTNYWTLGLKKDGLPE